MARQPLVYWVMSNVHDEIKRQDAKWGPNRDFPDVPSMLNYITMEDVALSPGSRLGIPPEDAAKALCESAFERGEGTWAHILLEEVCEAIDAPSEAEMREELVQVAAVTQQWIAAIDRRNGYSEEPTHLGQDT